MRSRHYEEEIDGRWVEDLRSDIGRIARQQDFIRRALSRAIDRGARNPGTLDQLIDVALDGITVDGQLTADDIFDLGTRFRSFDPDSLPPTRSRARPTRSARPRSCVWSRDRRPRPSLSIFRGGAAEGIEPAGVRLTVRNGTGTPSEGAQATEALQGAGFIANVSGDEPGGGAEGTVVRYPPTQEAAADLVARWLVGGARLEPVEGAEGIELVTGTDWQGVRDEATPSTSTTTATTLPEATTTTTDDQAPSSEEETTTSVDLATLDC